MTEHHNFDIGRWHLEDDGETVSWPRSLNVIRDWAERPGTVTFTVTAEMMLQVLEAAAGRDRTSRRRKKVKAWRDQLKQKLSIAGVTPFYMVAAVPDGQHAYSEEQEREFQPQKRYLNHKSALAMAWHMCRKFTRPFVVLGVCGIASPVLPDKTERDDEAEPKT